MPYTIEQVTIDGTVVTIANGPKRQTVNVPKGAIERGDYGATYESEQQNMWTDQQKLKRDVQTTAELGPYLNKRGFNLK